MRIISKSNAIKLTLQAVVSQLSMFLMDNKIIINIFYDLTLNIYKSVFLLCERFIPNDNNQTGSIRK